MKTEFKVVGKEPEPERHRLCRRMLVGPWCNQPEEYEGYNGFVSWAGVDCQRSGRLVVTFTSGYWHGSPPTTEAALNDDEWIACLNSTSGEHIREFLQVMYGHGGPAISAPRGGRAHIMHSDDGGETWSKPETLVDTEGDDRHATVIELDDGTLLGTFATWPWRSAARKNVTKGSGYMLSDDGGKTWSEPMSPPGFPEARPAGFGNGSAIQLADRTVMWVMNVDLEAKPETAALGIYISSDLGKTFELVSIICADHDISEPSVAELADGRLVLITRDQGEICFSDDAGRTWSDLVSPGVRMFDPHLLMMPNGILACFHGSIQCHDLRVILSADGGYTWHGPGEHYGYSIDPGVYGYSHAALLPDGTAVVVYNDSGGHRGADARSGAIWAQHVKVSDAADGIEILPAPGSPAADDRPFMDVECGTPFSERWPKKFK